MIPHDYYDENENPELRGLENDEVAYDDYVADSDIVLPLYSTIGRGPRGAGVKATIVKETDDCFIFSIVDEDGKEYLTSENLHAGYVSFSEDDPNDPKEMIVSLRREGEERTYGVKLPKPIGSFIFQTVEDWVPLKLREDHVYNGIPKEKIYNISGHEVKPGDSLMFTVYTETERASGDKIILNYLAFGVVESVSSKYVSVYASLYSPLYSVESFIQGIREYVEEKVGEEKAERVIQDNLLHERINRIEARTDVVDVVGTKAELDNYDVSKITKDDIIKVLRDETKAYQTTYYRYTALSKTKKKKKNAASDWTYVGCSGPFVLQAPTKKGTVYAVDSSGNETNIKYNNGVHGNALILRDSDGKALFNDGDAGENSKYGATVGQLTRGLNNEKSERESEDAKKVDKISTTGLHAYTHTGLNQGEVEISTDSIANSLARYNSDGKLHSGGSLDDHIVVNKGELTTLLNEYAKLAGAHFTGDIVFDIPPTTSDAYEYLSTKTLIAGDGISLDITPTGLKIVNTMAGKYFAIKGDIIFSTELDTEEKVIGSKGGLRWELLSEEGGVYEWHCLEGGRPPSTITIDIDEPVVQYDDTSLRSTTVHATCSDPTATLTWSIDGGDDCVEIS